MKIEKMRPKWIKVGETEKDLFDVIDLVVKGVSIGEIAKTDSQVTVDELRRLLWRAKSYLQSHLILDSYLETANKLPVREFKLGWTAHEIRELVELHISGASVKNISDLMRKEKTIISEKLQSLNLL